MGGRVASIKLRRMAMAALLANATLCGSAGADDLNSALVAAYRVNPEIKAERARQASTDEQVAQALSGFRPSANATYLHGRQRTDLNDNGWNYGSNDVKSLRVAQPLFRGGGTFSSYNSAKQRVLAGRNQLYAREQRVLLDAVTAYMDVVAATSILQLARENEEALSQQLTAANERFEVGEVTRTDVAQSQSRLAVAHAQVVAAEGRLISAIADYERIIGYKPEGLLEKPLQLPELPVNLQEAMRQALETNPDLLSAVHAAKSSHYDVWTNTSAILPRVDLVGTVSRQNGAGAFGTDSFDQDQVALEVSIPIYQAGTEYSRVREAKALNRQRSYAVTDTRLSTDQQVARAWEQLETASAIMTTREQQIGAAEAALEGVRQEQQYGARTVLDVLDAEQELFNAQTNFEQSQRDRVVAAYGLLFAVGKLTPSYLHLAVEQYDPVENYEDIKWLPLGF